MLLAGSGLEAERLLKIGAVKEEKVWDEENKKKKKKEQNVLYGVQERWMVSSSGPSQDILEILRHIFSPLV